MSRIFETPLYPYARSPDQDAKGPVRRPVVVVGAGPVGLAAAIDLVQHGVPVVMDVADRLPLVPNPYLSRGADLVAYSGGKIIRGPQTAGMLLGRKDLIAAAFMNSAPHHAFARRGRRRRHGDAERLDHRARRGAGEGDPVVARGVALDREAELAHLVGEPGPRVPPDGAPAEALRPPLVRRSLGQVFEVGDHPRRGTHAPEATTPAADRKSVV